MALKLVETTPTFKRDTINTAAGNFAEILRSVRLDERSTPAVTTAAISARKPPALSEMML
jgi:hypothetical protein